MTDAPDARLASRAAQRRMDTLRAVLRHPDPAQLWFQIAEIAGEETYMRHGVTLDPGDVVIDAGANVGVAAAYFALIRQAGIVHCFEPVMPVFEVLAGNLGGVPGCVLHPEGLSSSTGTATIVYYAGATAMSGLYADPARDRELVRTVLLNRGVSSDEADAQVAGRYEAQSLRCRLRTLSSFLRTSKLDRVDLLKIDVERAELDVLAGIDDADWPMIKQVVMEIHDEDGRGAKVAERLRAKGFRVASDQEEAMRGTSVRMLYAVRRRLRERAGRTL